MQGVLMFIASYFPRNIFFIYPLLPDWVCALACLGVPLLHDRGGQACLFEVAALSRVGEWACGSRAIGEWGGRAGTRVPARKRVGVPLLHERACGSPAIGEWVAEQRAGTRVPARRRVGVPLLHEWASDSPASRRVGWPRRTRCPTRPESDSPSGFHVL